MHALATETTLTDHDHWMDTDCFSTSVRRIDRILARLYDDALRPSGLVTTQYALLSTLSRAPENLPLTQLARAMAMDRSTLSRNLTPLVRDAFVQLTVGDDRRARQATITPEGRRKLAEARPLWHAAQQHVTTLADGHDITQTLRHLADLVSPIRETIHD